VERIWRTIARGQVALALTVALGLSTGVAMAPRATQAMTERQSPVLQASLQHSTDASILVASQPLTTGCNQVTETGLTVGGKISDWVTANVQPMSAVISVWHYDNASQHYQAAYFNVSAVPVDVTTFPQAVDAYFICVGASASAP